MHCYIGIQTLPNFMQNNRTGNRRRQSLSNRLLGTSFQSQDMGGIKDVRRKNEYLQEAAESVFIANADDLIRQIRSYA